MSLIDYNKSVLRYEIQEIYETPHIYRVHTISELHFPVSLFCNETNQNTKFIENVPIVLSFPS